MAKLNLTLDTSRMGDALRAYASDVGASLPPPKKSEWREKLDEGERVEGLAALYLRSLGYAVQSLASADCQARPEILTAELDYSGAYHRRHALHPSVCDIRRVKRFTGLL